MSTDVRTDRKWFAEADILRAACMLWVIGPRHIAGYSPYLTVLNSFPGAEILVYICLGLFCTLSGFLLARGNDNTISWEAVGPFYRKRLVRIYPPYLIAVLVLYLLEVTGYVGVYSKGFGLDTRAMLASCGLVAIFLDCAPVTLWFVNLIAVYYIVAPFLMWKGNTRYIFWLGAFLAGVVLLAISLKTDLIDKRLFLFSPSFFYGLLLGLYPRFREWAFSSQGVVVSTVVGVSAAIVCMSTGAPSIVAGGVSAPFAMPLSWQVAHVVVSSKRMRRYAAIAAYASFFAYLIHRATYTMAYYAISPQSASAAWIYWVGLVLPGTLLAAYWLQYSYDAIARSLMKVSTQPAERTES